MREERIDSNLEKFNWYGMYNLSLREIKRFLRVYHQTVIGPVVSAILFLLIFSFAMKKNLNSKESLSFIGYGIIIMSIIQNAFANSSSSLIMFKVLGYIIDILIPPLGGVEIILAFIIGSVVRSVIVGISVGIALSMFIDFQLHSIGCLVCFTILGSVFLAQLGILSGIVSKSFEQNTAFTNYVVMPLSFLSGTFYSVKNLAPAFQKFNLVNPFFYIIDGFRFSFMNHHETNLIVGGIYLVTLNILFFGVLKYIFATGWRIKD